MNDQASHIRRAHERDADALTELAIRSKASWGYDAAFMDRCRPILTVTGEYIRRTPAWVAQQGQAIVGFYSLREEDGILDLDLLFVEPEWIGSGVGALLLEHALQQAALTTHEHLVVESDPGAEGFYLRFGATRVGQRASTVEAGRQLPMLSFDLAAASLSHAARLVRACRPDTARRALEFIGEGDFCRAYLLNGQEIVRVPKHARAGRALAREACLLAQIAPLLAAPVPLPLVQTVSVAGACDEATVSIHERLAGTELTLELWRSLTEPERVLLARRLGAFLQSLHTVDVAIARGCGVPDMDHAAHATRLRAEVRGQPGALLPEPLRQAVEAWLGRYLKGGTAWQYGPATLNADVSPEHVLIDVECAELTGVIDWGDASIGDPARDFIFLYEDWGPEFLGLALDGYELEPAGRILPRVHMQYVLDQLAWTLQAGGQQRAADLEHGVAALRSAVHDLENSCLAR